jgi:hypothetical protein
MWNSNSDATESDKLTVQGYNNSLFNLKLNPTEQDFSDIIEELTFTKAIPILAK